MFELLLLPFFQRALLVGIILGTLMAILGVFVVLRRMSFFADAIGHSALTGIALGLLFNFSPFVGALIFTLFVAFVISGIRIKTKLPVDTLLGVLFPASVALSVIIVSLTPGYQADLISFLFGNILTVSTADVIGSIVIALVVFAIMIWSGKELVAISFDPSLAKAEGIAVARHELFFLLLLAAVIALAIKFVGIVLVTALLIIPAASAQNLARSLSSMFWISIVFSFISVVVGMLASTFLRSPSGPTIVLTGAILFTFSLVARTLRPNL